MTRPKLAILFIILMLVVVLGTLPACTKNEAVNPSNPVATATQSGEKPLKGGTLTWVRNVGPLMLGAPSDLKGWAEPGPLWPVFSPLFSVDARGNVSTEPPALTESYEVAPDGSTITLHLRQGIKFQDGTDFDAAAVQANLETDAANNCYGSAVLKKIDSYKIIDTYTLQINMKQYDCTLLLKLAQTTVAFMASPAALKKATTPETMAKDHMVGTGAFKLAEFVRDQYIRYVAWDGYWEPGKPYLDAIEYRINTDVTTSIMSLKAGEVNMVDNVDPVDGLALANEGYQVNRAESGGGIFNLVPDSATPDSPYADLKVRLALEYALDKQAIADGIGKGSFVPVYQVGGWEGEKAYNPALAPRTYDPDKARELLKEAGYEAGFDYPILSDVRLRQDQLVAVQTYLMDVGITGTLDVADPTRFTSFQTQGWNGLLIPGLPYMSFFSGVMGRLYDPVLTYPGQVQPDGWVDKVNAVLAQTDPAKAEAGAQELGKLIYDQALIIPIVADCGGRWASDGTVMDMDWQGHFTLCYWNPQNTWLKPK
jgi:peptide/nickel transport system substrate-binding protein